jgi:hypothetical protein
MRLHRKVIAMLVKKAENAITILTASQYELTVIRIALQQYVDRQPKNPTVTQESIASAAKMLLATISEGIK